MGADLTFAPVWSPTTDLLLHGSPLSEPAIIEDLAAGTSRKLELAWPAAFDRTGTLVYSPAWSPSSKSTGLSTTIVDGASGAAVATLPGAPPWWFVWPGSVAVAAFPGGTFAVLQQAVGCSGTAIYIDDKMQQCVSDGVEGQIGPGGLIAVARQTGTVGPAYGPGFETVSIAQFDIDVIGPGGQVQTMVRGAVSFNAPLMVWNAEGTHLLVLWPRSIGL
jgi:hypothetical protein